MRKNRVYDYILFIEAWIFLSFAKLLIIFFPFKKIAALIGNPQVESPKKMHEEKIIKDIEVAIIRGIKYVFFFSKCYDQALATTFMLKRRKIVSTIYFGLDKEGEQLIAHAWVRCGEKIISGRLGHERFTAVAWFGFNNLM
jgi:hypothetical protein